MSIPDLSNLSAKYGAPMGRYPSAPIGEAKMHLHKLPLDNGGYDGGCAYWGMPDDIWRVVADSEDEEDYEMFIRAGSREEALAALKEDYPDLEILPLEAHFQSALTACLNTIDWDWELSANDLEEDPWVTLDDESKELMAKLLKEFIDELGPDASKVESADLGAAYWMIRQYGDCGSADSIAPIQNRVVGMLHRASTLEWEVVGDNLHIYP